MAEDQARTARPRWTLLPPLPAQAHCAADTPAAFGAATQPAAEGLA